MSRPKMPFRDMGGMFKIGNPDDATPIREMFTLSEAMLMITDKCIYRIQVADQIDPERKNPSLPHNMQQKLHDHGVESELLCRVFLQSKVLFRKEFQQIDNEAARQLALEAFSNLAAAQDVMESFWEAEQSAIEQAKKSEHQSASITIPSVGDVRNDCKTFAQKIDHAVSALMKIVRLLYPEMKNKNWTEFSEMVKTKYGESDKFYQVAEIATPLFALVRNARDCLEHVNKGVITRDFELLPDGTISVPTIEINFRGSKLERSQISAFMKDVIKAVMINFEMIVVHMCSKCASPIFTNMAVGLLPENYQKAWHVRFSYGSLDHNGNFIPCG